jgi:hypothetical protein
LEAALDFIDDLYKNNRAPYEEVSETRLLLLEANWMLPKAKGAKKAK